MERIDFYWLLCRYLNQLVDNEIFNEKNIPCVVAEVPKQNNGSDCGLFVCKFVQEILNNNIISTTTNINNNFKRKFKFKNDMSEERINLKQQLDRYDIILIHIIFI